MNSTQNAANFKTISPEMISQRNVDKVVEKINNIQKQYVMKADRSLKSIKPSDFQKQMRLFNERKRSMREL